MRQIDLEDAILGRDLLDVAQGLTTRDEALAIALHIAGALTITGLLVASLWYFPTAVAADGPPGVQRATPLKARLVVKPFTCEVRRPCTADNDNH